SRYVAKRRASGLPHWYGGHWKAIMSPSAPSPPLSSASTRSGTDVSLLRHRRMWVTPVWPVGKDPERTADSAGPVPPTRNSHVRVIGSRSSCATARAGAVRGAHPAKHHGPAGRQRDNATPGVGLPAKRVTNRGALPGYA